MIESEHFWNEVRSLSNETLTSEERKALLSALSGTTILKKAMGICLNEIAGHQNRFFSINFADEGSRVEAAKVQAECNGFARAYQALVDLANSEEMKEEE